MQLVSQVWKDNQKEHITSESYLSLFYEISDVDALMDATSSDNGHTYYSDTGQVISEVYNTIIPYITMEHNLWLLDGGKQTIPSLNPMNAGYVSTFMSGDDCKFTDNVPALIITFTEVHSNKVPGITMTWSSAFDEYAKSFKLVVYNGETIVSEKMINDNDKPEMIIEQDIYDYDRISLEIYEWSLPNHRPRIERILMGIRKTYEKEDIMDFKQTMSLDPISGELPKSEIEFSLRNDDGTFDLNNVQGVARYLVERQSVKVEYGFKNKAGKFEKINGGVFYLSSWDAPQTGLKATFKAGDLFSFLQKKYIKGTYRSEGVSLYDLAADVLTEADVLLNEDGTVKWIIDASLKTITTMAPLPIVTLAECLQYIAQAACCMIYTDRTGMLRIGKPNDQITDYEVNFFNSKSYAKVNLEKPLKEVEVNVYSYTADAESTELFKGTLTIDGNVDLELAYSSAATNAVATVTGGTLNKVEYYSNACRMNITATGNVSIIITGNPIQESTSTCIVNHLAKGEIQVVENPLITTRAHALTVGNWVKDWLSKRSKFELNWRADPRLDAGDIIKVEDKYGNNSVRVTEFEFSYTGGAMTGRAEGRGL